MDSVTLNWFWFGLLVVVVVRALAAPSSVLSSLRRHSTNPVRTPTQDAATI